MEYGIINNALCKIMRTSSIELREPFPKAIIVLLTKKNVVIKNELLINKNKMNQSYIIK